MSETMQFEDDYVDECCPECGGEGWVEGECFEDTCCCTTPHEMVRCVCNPPEEVR